MNERDNPLAAGSVGAPAASRPRGEPSGSYQRTPHKQRVGSPPTTAHDPAAGATTEKDLGPLGRTIVWGLAFLIFGGGLAAWFFLATIVEAQIGGRYGMLNPGSKDAAHGVKTYLEASGLEEEDIQFLAEQYGVDAETFQYAGPEEPEPGFPTEGTAGETTVTEDFPPPRYAPPEIGADSDVEWPDYRLIGAMAGTESKPGSVILDGNLVQVGNAYQGVRVLEIEANGAVLEFEGERRWFSSGQSISQ